MNKRDQAVRYLEMGEDAEDIAALLGIPSAVVHEIERAMAASMAPTTDKPSLPDQPVPASLQAAILSQQWKQSTRIARLRRRHKDGLRPIWRDRGRKECTHLGG